MYMYSKNSTLSLSLSLSLKSLTEKSLCEENLSECLDLRKESWLVHVHTKKTYKKTADDAVGEIVSRFFLYLSLFMCL